MKPWNMIRLAWKNRKLARMAAGYQPWDYYYLLRMEKEMLEKMAGYYPVSGMLENREKVGRDAGICSRLIDIILEEDTSVESYDDWNPETRMTYRSIRHVNPRNAGRFMPHPPKEWDPLLLDSLRIRKASHLYGMIREYFLTTWWD